MPQRSWLEYYARQFPTVEVNSTFYRLPKRESVAAWCASVPDQFEFALKGSKFVTQNKKLIDFEQHAPLLMERIDPLVGTTRAGPILWQLPEGWKARMDRLEWALDHLPAGVRHTFEFRDATWFERQDELLEMLRARGVALTIGHHPDRAYQPWELTADWSYVRLHFSADDSTGRYSSAEIARLADWVVRQQDVLQDVYVYFNNDWNAYAIENARELAAVLGIRLPGVTLGQRSAA